MNLRVILAIIGFHDYYDDVGVYIYEYSLNMICSTVNFDLFFNSNTDKPIYVYNLHIYLQIFDVELMLM